MLFKLNLKRMYSLNKISPNTHQQVTLTLCGG